MNKVELKGTIINVKSGRGQKAAWARCLLEPHGAKGKFGVSAFHDAGEALGAMEDGDTVEITGHLERSRKAKDSEEWETVVVADEVRHAEEEL